MLLHYGFDLLNLIPKATCTNITKKEDFRIDYSFFLNITFLILSEILIYSGSFKEKNIKHNKKMAPKCPLLEKVLKW